MCGGLALRRFRYEELELLVCGLPHLDFAELQASTRYEGGYTAEHEVIKHFWDVVMGFTFEQKRSFLKFCTGTDRYNGSCSNIAFRVFMPVLVATYI